MVRDARRRSDAGVGPAGPRLMPGPARAPARAAEIEDLPGVRELWRETLGDPGVTIGLVEGPPDLAHPCFRGADLTLIEPSWLPQVEPEEPYVEHGTFVASMLFGQHGGPVRGLAPRCRGLVVPALRDEATALDPMNATRAINALVGEGANVIHFSGTHPTRSDDTSDLLKRAIRQAARAGVLIVAPAGNDHGEHRAVPAVLPEVLAVGAFDGQRTVFKFSNWGPQYRDHGVTAPGDMVRAAEPGGGTASHKGTSVAAPVVSGVAALLTSLRRENGLPANSIAVRDALIRGAARCAPEQAQGDPERCLAGQLDIPAAMRLVRPASSGCARTGIEATAVPEADSVVPAAGTTGRRRKHLVYALGSLGYDFDGETRRDWFSAAIRQHLGVQAADPYDVRQLVRLLVRVPEAAKGLTWTLRAADDVPAYALRPAGSYAAPIHRQLVALLAAQSAAVSVKPLDAEDSGEPGGAGTASNGAPPSMTIERVAVPGHVVARRVALLSGQLVPVVKIVHKRGLCGWNIDHLVDQAIAAAGVEVQRTDRLKVPVRQFLERIYFSERNLGRRPPDRALNFAATNPIQAVRALASAMAAGMELDSIDVEKSPFCRMGSDCWEIALRYVDPDDDDRAGRVHRFTIDVSDIVPVTLGEIRMWPESRRGEG
ncbi:S8 family serine peptidase [Saccharopolyspora sp. NFXS83]|uniref:cyanobactin maturation protease PatG family protein n=1 Tax=Saccharopolyspora sp. NFXS83 TaxID=2993560 RepID=UPI00224B59DE|nr:S8 family serine peptidase [Saccharopolyspora sp. NFXS83]MCX2729194.1 S8 family serine peptidase [Saccharopolyspora sp. NFXS83]